jgi:uncharacterized LabA/DUF88 family protein
VRFYTAPVKGKLCDDIHSPQRQRTYWQALRTHCGETLKIIEGKFALSTPFLRLAAPVAGLAINTNVQVFALDEKKSDVNLAVDMFDVACASCAEQIVLCSNDSDFESALALIKLRYPGIRLGLIAPIAKEEHRYLSNDLRQHCDWAKPLSRIHLQAAQLPARIPGTALRRPEAWQS